MNHRIDVGWEEVAGAGSSGLVGGTTDRFDDEKASFFSAFGNVPAFGGQQESCACSDWMNG